MSRREANIDCGFDFNGPAVEQVWLKTPLADGIQRGLLKHGGTADNVE